MRVCAVICEYNPFHNGHARHLTLAREKERRGLHALPDERCAHAARRVRPP